MSNSFEFMTYSHLSNKRDVTLTNFEKFHPTQNKNPPYTFIDFLEFSTLHKSRGMLKICESFSVLFSLDHTPFLHFLRISNFSVSKFWILKSYFYSQIFRKIAQCVHHSIAFSALYIYKKVCCKLWCNYLCGPFRHIWMRFSTKATRGAKGHLISEGNFGVFKSPKKRTKLFEDFLP